MISSQKIRRKRGEGTTLYNNLPPQIIRHARFCCWRYEQRSGRGTKVPYDPETGRRARTDRQQTFRDYNAALAAVERYDGIGILVGNGICAIDLDDCFDENDNLKLSAKDIVDMFSGCYIELSPSGKGLRIIFYATSYTYDKTKYYINNRTIGLEVYVAGATNRFVTLTGNVYREGKVLEKTEVLRAMLDKYMLRPVPVRKGQHVGKGHSYLSDESVIKKASSSGNEDKFKALWQGNVTGYASQSEADLALCGILAFWCGRDTEQMDRLFRKSGLIRDKWDRPQSGSTYGQITLNKVVGSINAEYNPQVYYEKQATESAVSDFKQTLDSMQSNKNERYGWNDIGNGNLFADWYKDIARYVPERKIWYVYNGKVWRPDAGNLKVMELCKKLADGLMIYALSIKDEQSRSAYIDFVRKWQGRKYRETILKDACSVYPIPMAYFDHDPNILNSQNGTLDLKTMKFRDHNPEDMLSKIAGVKYDPDAKCERWERYISEVMSGDVEKATFLQKALGYALSGNTMYEALFILYGATTRNGKGTCMETILRIMGDYGKTARPETIGMKMNNNSGGPSEDIARLAGARFVNISEPDKKLILSSALVKTLTGNDSINARYLHENSFEYRPQFKLFINTNYLPTVTDLTLFSSGRVKIIPFERHFEEGEQDKGLKAEFSKSENLSAILNWCIQGYQMLKAEGLDMPASVRKATETYHHDSDKIGLFVEDTMEKDPRGEVRTSDAYSRYRQWCYDNGHYTENVRNFKSALSTIVTIERKRPRTGGGATTLIMGYKMNTEDKLFAL